MTKLIAPLCSSTLLLCSNYEKTIAICCLKGLFVMKNDEKFISKLNVLLIRKLWTLVNRHNNLDQLNISK